MVSAAQLNPTVDFIAGTIAGTTALIVGFPFDTVKVRFQDPANAQRYSGSTLCTLVQIVREETLAGLFRGISSPLALVALMNGLVFASYHFFLKMQLSQSDAVPTLLQVGLAGVGSGIVSSIVTTPTELLKIQQQTCHTGSSLSLARAIFNEAGLPGLYRGLPATALRDIGYGAYFFAYEAVTRFFSALSSLPDDAFVLPEADTQSELARRRALSFCVLIIAGSLSGIAGWLFTFPMDVVKTRMQAREYQFQQMRAENDAVVQRHLGPALAHALGDPSHALWAERQPLLDQHVHAVESTVLMPRPHLHPYRSVLSTIVNSYRTEGVGVFFRGLGPTLLRAIPANVVTFATFEAVVHAFGHLT
ncbi:mitochondrial carrier domain-containing protein [Pterulicium gracile]|uniref:Mitochondrial carrier domain-containing protein n=1 Tax=Pterulicium gracile TaxID=1884261 RepID=A0A5C3QJQ6_9AGAR|nr:mitochondrial carrier domain-containing protein [Pterula gracilis]